MLYELVVTYIKGSLELSYELNQKSLNSEKIKGNGRYYKIPKNVTEFPEGLNKYYNKNWGNTDDDKTTDTDVEEDPVVNLVIDNALLEADANIRQSQDETTKSNLSHHQTEEVTVEVEPEELIIEEESNIANTSLELLQAEGEAVKVQPEELILDTDETSTFLPVDEMKSDYGDPEDLEGPMEEKNDQGIPFAAGQYINCSNIHPFSSKMVTLSTYVNVLQRAYCIPTGQIPIANLDSIPAAFSLSSREELECLSFLVFKEFPDLQWG